MESLLKLCSGFDPVTLGTAVISGVLTGLVYGLSALGLSVIFGVIRIVNFAHGEIMVLGMFLALMLFRWFGLDPLWSIPIAAAALFVVGYALQNFVIRRVAYLPDHYQFLLLAGIAIMIVSACLVIFGPDAQGFWTRGTDRGTVFVVPAGASQIVLTLHVGPNAGTVRLDAAGERRDIVMGPNETQRVVIAAPIGMPVVSVSVQAPGWFRPIDVEPGSTDMRALGCQVRVEVP